MHRTKFLGSTLAVIALGSVCREANASKLSCQFRILEVERDARGRVTNGTLTRGTEGIEPVTEVDVDGQTENLSFALNDYEKKRGWTVQLAFERRGKNHSATLALANSKDERAHVVALTQFSPSEGFNLEANDIGGFTLLKERDHISQQLRITATCQPKAEVAAQATDTTVAAH